MGYVLSFAPSISLFLPLYPIIIRENLKTIYGKNANIAVKQLLGNPPTSS